jgi:hypothetical protein
MSSRPSLAAPSSIARRLEAGCWTFIQRIRGMAHGWRAAVMASRRLFAPPCSGTIWNSSGRRVSFAFSALSRRPTTSASETCFFSRSETSASATRPLPLIRIMRRPARTFASTSLSVMPPPLATIVTEGRPSVSFANNQLHRFGLGTPAIFLGGRRVIDGDHLGMIWIDGRLTSRRNLASRGDANQRKGVAACTSCVSRCLHDPCLCAPITDGDAATPFATRAKASNIANSWR